MTTPSWALLVFRHFLHDGVFQAIASWTTNMAHLGAGRFAELAFPLPEIAEQQRIVEVANALESNIDAGITAIKQGALNLERYRAAVFKAACEGRLVPTEAVLARKEGREYERADVLLERIRKEHRASWEAEEIAKRPTKAQLTCDQQWRTKYKQPKPPEQNERSKLAEGWTAMSLDQIRDGDAPIVYGIIQPGDDVQGGVPYLRPKDIDEDGKVDFTSIKRTSTAIAAKYGRARLRSGDIVLSIVGTIGKLCVAPAELDGGNITQSSARIRPSSLISANYVRVALLSPQLRGQYALHSFGNAVQRLNVEHVRRLVIPIPPLAEQQRIVTEVDRLLSVTDATEQIVRAQLARARSLRQAVLKRAFEGKLVPKEATQKTASAQVGQVELPKSERRVASVLPVFHVVPSTTPSVGEALRDFRVGQGLSARTFASRFEIDADYVTKLELIASPFEPERLTVMREAIRATLPSLRVGQVKRILDELLATRHSEATEEDRITAQAARKLP
jgi:type I restriction enzyme S subunit